MPSTEPPWNVLEHLNRVVDKSRPNLFADYIVIGSAAGEVCRVPNPVRDESMRFDPTARANAHLIAAAPELLLACQLLCALEDNDVNDADTRWKQVRKDIRDAVAKATAHPSMQ
jgi:hypothetical protein